MDVCQLLLDFDLFRVFLKLLPVFLPFLAPLAEENGYLRHGTIPTKYIRLQCSETRSQLMSV